MSVQFYVLELTRVCPILRDLIQKVCPLYPCIIAQRTQQQQSITTVSLESKSHQTRVEGGGQEKVSHNNSAEWVDGDESVDLPEIGSELREHNHHCCAEEAEDEGTLEVLNQLRDFLEEGCVFGFLAGSSPRHIDAEEVGEDSLRDVQRDTAQEDGKKRDPGEVLDDSVEETALTSPVAQDGKGKIAKSGEHNNDGKIDLERIDVEVVKRTVQPAHKEVVGQSQDPSRAKREVGTDVGHNGELGWERHARAHEAQEELGERSPGRPVAEWLENQLGATVGVLLPTGQLVVDSERDTLLETFTSIATEANDVSVGLQTKSHVKVLRDGLLRPELLVVVVLAVIADGLDSGPPHDSVVTDEGRNITVSDSELDGSIDQVSEEGDSTLEERIGDVHDTGSVLDDGNLRGLLHLRDGVKETVGGDTGVGVDQEDVVTHADVAIGPGAALVLLNNFGESVAVSVGLIFLSPALVTLDQQELLLNAVADPERVVHIGGLLELSAAVEALLTLGGLGVVLRSGNPSNVVFIVEVLASTGIIFGDELHTVVIDEDVGGTTLHLVGGNGGLEGADGGLDDSNETLLVDWHLNSDVRKVSSITAQALRPQTRVVLGVLVHLRNRPNDLGDLADECLKEEKAEPEQERYHNNEGNADVVLVNRGLERDLPETKSEAEERQSEGNSSEDGLPEDDSARLLDCAALNEVPILRRDLVDHDTAILLLVHVVRSGIVPDHFHESLLDLVGTVEQVTRLVIPDDQETAVSDEGGELMLLAAREVGDVGKDLEAETVLERDEWSVVVVEEELDDTGVDSHGDLK